MGSGVEIYVEMHFFVLQSELDHAAARGELGHFADGQNIGALEIREDLGETIAFGRADVENLAGADAGIILNVPNLNGPVVQSLFGGEGGQGVSKRVRAEDTQKMRGLRVGIGGGGPVDEFDEVIQHGGF